MVLTKREKYITIAILIGAGALLLDTLLLGPYLDWRSSLVAQCKSEAAALDEAHKTLENEKQLRKTLSGMDATMTSDSSSAEAQLHHVIHDWEQQAAVTNPSFERVRTTEEHGFIHLTYHVSVEGSTQAVAMLLYRIETAAIPIRIDDMQVTAKGDDGNDLQVHLSISSVCRSPVSPAPRTAGGNAMAGAQGGGNEP